MLVEQGTLSHTPLCPRWVGNVHCALVTETFVTEGREDATVCKEAARPVRVCLLVLAPHDLGLRLSRLRVQVRAPPKKQSSMQKLMAKMKEIKLRVTGKGVERVPLFKPQRFSCIVTLCPDSQRLT